MKTPPIEPTDEIKERERGDMQMEIDKIVDNEIEQDFLKRLEPDNDIEQMMYESYIEDNI